jgi:enoyl-CoA hydratase/carnithine racemase
VSVAWELRGTTAWITFDRPSAHNAMTFEMYEQLHALCARAEAADDVRAVVLRGAGGRAFVAGTDIREFSAFASAEDGVAYEAMMDRVIGALERMRTPTVALVEGWAMGAGLLLSAACDLRVCTPAASFGLPIARNVGNCISMEGYARLAALLGEARVKDLVFRARCLSGEEALAIGFASELVAAEEAEAAAAALCETLAGHAAVTLRATKEALRRLRPLPDSTDLLREAYGSTEFHATVARFLARRSRSARSRVPTQPVSQSGPPPSSTAARSGE